MIYLLFAFCILAAEFSIKRRIEAMDEAAFPIRLAGGFVLEKHHNYGFMLNRLDRHPKLVRISCLLVFLPLLAWSLRMFFKKESASSGDFFGKLGGACLAGGAASNLYDRFSRGYVVDYLRLPNRAGARPACCFDSKLPHAGLRIKKIRNVIFNIADFFIFLGGAFTAVYGFFTK